MSESKPVSESKPDSDHSASTDPKDRRDRKDGKGRKDRKPARGEAHRGTQLSSTDALRAREFAQPTADDLAAAEAEVVLVRRHYVPPAPLPGSGRGKAGGSGRR